VSVTKVTGMMQTSTKGGDISSASPTVIDTDGDYFDVTGTTNFAAFTVAAGRRFTVQFDGVLTMTHDATDLDLPGGANITTAAGDVAEFFATGTNTVQCVNYTKADGTALAGGRIVQVVNVMDSALQTGTTTYPADDTIPQNTEGDEVMTLAITPTNASNKLIIQVTAGFHSHSATNNGMGIMLFQDSTAGAIAAVRDLQSLGTGPDVTTFLHYMAAGTTSSTTFKVRVGGNAAGTTTWNGIGGARKFGGVVPSSITIWEIAV